MAVNLRNSQSLVINKQKNLEDNSSLSMQMEMVLYQLMNLRNCWLLLVKIYQVLRLKWYLMLLMSTKTEASVLKNS